MPKNNHPSEEFDPSLSPAFSEGRKLFAGPDAGDTPRLNATRSSSKNRIRMPSNDTLEKQLAAVAADKNIAAENKARIENELRAAIAEKNTHEINKLARAEFEAGRSPSFHEARLLIDARLKVANRVGVARIFKRLLMKEETTAEQIAKLQGDIARERATAEQIQRRHVELVACCAEVTNATEHANGLRATLIERLADSESVLHRRFRSSGNTDEVIRASGHLQSLTAALAELSKFIAVLANEASAHNERLDRFEKEHAADLALVATNEEPGS